MALSGQETYRYTSSCIGNLKDQLLQYSIYEFSLKTIQSCDKIQKLAAMLRLRSWGTITSPYSDPLTMASCMLLYQNQGINADIKPLTIWDLVICLSVSPWGLLPVPPIASRLWYFRWPCWGRPKKLTRNWAFMMVAVKLELPSCREAPDPFPTSLPKACKTVLFREAFWNTVSLLLKRWLFNCWWKDKRTLPLCLHELCLCWQQDRGELPLMILTATKAHTVVPR